MGFFTLLKSLDELLYEVMSWLIFYPLTLWRAVRHPLTMMRYADSELRDPPEQQYSEALSPPQFLLVTLILSHLIELAIIGDSPLVSDRRGIAMLISDDTNLIALRMIAFATYPLVMATRMVRAKKEKLDRQTLKLPFYSQCYAATPLALMMSLAATLLQCTPRWAQLAGVALVLVAIPWFLSVQIAWFRHELGLSWWRAVGQALRGYIEAGLIVFLINSAIVPPDPKHLAISDQSIAPMEE